MMKGFVFDLDNTLFDRYATLTEIAKQNYESVKEYINPGYNFDRALNHFLHTEKLTVLHRGWKGVLEQLTEEHFFNADRIPSWEVFWDFISGNFKKVAVQFPYSKPLLEAIRQKGYKVALLTNGSISLQDSKLRLLGLENSFDLIVCASPKEEDSDITIQKPHPEPFWFTAEKLGIPPGELYYVGDNPVNDMQGARAAGYVPVWIRAQSPWIGPNSEIPALCYDDVRGLYELL